MTRTNSRREWAQALWQALPRDTAPITWREVNRRTGLTRKQIKIGLATLRDTNPELPVISGYDGYRISTEQPVVARFQIWRGKVAYTTIRRTYYGAILPFLALLPQDKSVQAVRRQFERALEDLADLIEF